MVCLAGAACLPIAVAVVVTRDTSSSLPAPSTQAPVMAAAPVVAAPTVAPTVAPEPVVDPTVHDTLGNGEALGTALSRNGVGANDVSSLVRDLKGTIDVRSLRVGARFSVLVDDAGLQRFTFRARGPGGVPRTVIASRMVDDSADGSRYDVLVEDAVITTEVAGLAGSVRGSLYNGVLDAGGDANLVNKFVDVFAWNIDFYRQARAGDEFKVLVEKRFADDGDERRFMGYGKVLAAEYVNAGMAYRGFNFATNDGALSGFFDEDGESLERTFLRNPMEITRITSSYGMRFHPVLKTEKKHQGIDYGAPIGTPIWTVADGVVQEARYSKSAGNMITISHINGYTTEYFHMSKFADGMRPGVRVKQKQLIGYVGTTGRSTGPHLHFGMLRSGSHLDPAKQKFPNAKPIPGKHRSEFDAYVQPLMAALSALTRA